MNTSAMRMIIVSSLLVAFTAVAFLWWAGKNTELTLGDASSSINTNSAENYLEKPLSQDELLREIPGIQLAQDSPNFLNEGGCVVTGCSNQICSDEGVTSTCEWLGEYACYSDAVCERQGDGVCGWTASATLDVCIADARTLEAAVEISPGGTVDVPQGSPDVVATSEIPEGCSQWFDGCNECGVSAGEVAACTKRHCFVPGDAYCRQYAEGFDQVGL